MMEGLGWTKADIGILTGALFWTYGIGQFVNGRLSEIVGPAKFVVALVVLSVAANVLMAFQTSLVAMAVRKREDNFALVSALREIMIEEGVS